MSDCSRKTDRDFVLGHHESYNSVLKSFITKSEPKLTLSANSVSVNTTGENCWQYELGVEAVEMKQALIKMIPNRCQLKSRLKSFSLPKRPA